MGTKTANECGCEMSQGEKEQTKIAQLFVCWPLREMNASAAADACSAELTTVIALAKCAIETRRTAQRRSG